MHGRLRRRTGRLVGGLLGRFGYQLVRASGRDGLPGPGAIPPDCDPRIAAIIRRVRYHSLTSPERLMALCESVRYVGRARVPGAIVECGVWRGGSMMAAALTLLEVGEVARDLYLYDTFDSYPPPDERDEQHTGDRQMAELHRMLEDSPEFSLFPIERVQELIEATEYPLDRVHLIPGLIEETIPAKAPEQIAVCRLDTNWYASTAHELEHLYPRIAPRGVLLIDDYGSFPGTRRAVDEYLAEYVPDAMLVRVDVAGRLLFVPDR